MAWKRRPRRQPAFVRSHRDRQGRTHTKYYGTGFPGELAALNFEEEKLARQEQNVALQRQKDEFEAALPVLDDFCRWCELLWRAALIDRGYTQRSRTRWRKRKMRRGPSSPQQPLAASTTLPSESEFRTIIASANNGNHGAQHRLRAILTANPAIWRVVGDLAVHARQSVIRVIANGNELIAEAVARKADELTDELIRPGASRLEQLAVERVVGCWLETQFADAMTNAGEPAQQKFALKLRESSQRRYAEALTCLATLQQMMPPAAD